MNGMPMLMLITVAIMVSVGLTVAGHYLRPPRRWLIYVFKPLTTILIIAIALLPGTFASDGYARAVVIGLVFSLAGDIFLVMPDRWFLFGLAAFLLAHISYIVAFRSGAGAPGFGLALLALGAFGAAVCAYLWKGVPGKMRGPVVAYILVIISMAALAVGRAMGEPSRGTLAAAVGALLFVASDAMLAISRFRRPFRLAEALILPTYFAAQWLIAVSVWGS